MQEMQVQSLGQFPEGVNGKLFQYSCLENPMDRGAWLATVHSVTKSLTCLSMQACALNRFCSSTPNTHTHTLFAIV